MTRRAFIEQHGATCRNWTWSWSFVNDKKKFVIFGVWAAGTEGGRSLVLSDLWMRRNGRRNPGYTQAREHIRLIQEEGYKLMTYPIKWDEDRTEDEPARIAGFVPELTSKKLVQDGDSWYAL
jgi:5-methylcytosine-specific restriction protein A